MTTEVENNIADAEVIAPETEKVDLLKPNPAVLIGIITTSLALLDEGKKDKETNVIYITTKKFVQQTAKDSSTTDLTPAIFTHYLEAYRLLQNMKVQAGKLKANPLDPSNLYFYNEAALSIFDLYLDNPQDGLIRRILQLSANALHQVIATHQSADETKNMKEVIGDLSNVALLAQTLGDYVKGMRRRKNYAYIRWLKLYFARMLATDDLSFMKDDKVMTYVIPQIMKNRPIIFLPTT